MYETNYRKYIGKNSDKNLKVKLVNEKNRRSSKTFNQSMIYKNKVIMIQVCP